ncbi:MAG: T9SS type A sorting domain-containing protein [Bacteroidetes bacterium]|nr:T9SS type A sorting domain-containing protein [Bacteroidota bacterium]
MIRYVYILIILFSNVYANAQSFVWAKAMGGTKSDYSASVAVDAAGNVYTIGYYLGTADFNPGPGTANLTAAGRSDIYISKLDAAGNFVWAKSIGGNGWDDGAGIAVDALGNIILTGHFSGTADFDPGAGTANLTAAGDYDIFICKLDAAGDYLWAESIGNNNGDYSWDVVADAMNNIYITGQFFGTLDFNPGAGASNMTSAGGYDFFICKLDLSGNFLWAKSLGGLNPDVSYSIDVDINCNVYTTGGFNGTVDFDPGASAFNLSTAGSEDVFILKLDSMGNFVWARSFGGNNFDSANALSVDFAGNIYTIGTFEGTADFNPGPGVSTITSSGFTDVFICKIDVAGNFVWAKNLSGMNYEDAFAVNTDNTGNVVFSGCFSSLVDFDPGIGTFNLTPSGAQDIFISMLDNTGNFLWAKALQGNNNIGCGISILVDGGNNIYTTGFFSSTVDFNPDGASFNISSAGNEDVFIHKMNYVNTPLPIELISFDGKANGSQNILKWTTGSEFNNDYFTVLRSKNGVDFESIGNVDGSGNSTSTLNYYFVDEQPYNGYNYYQLQQTDFDGQSASSRIVSILNSSSRNNPIVISPNPVRDFVEISNYDSNTIQYIELINALGEVIFRNQNQQLIDVSSLPAGTYSLRILLADNIYVSKFIKQ